MGGPPGRRVALGIVTGDEAISQHQDSRAAKPSGVNPISIAAGRRARDHSATAHPSGGRAMTYEVTKVEVWTREIDDRAGSLAAALEPLAKAGVDLSFMIARRYTHQKGKAVVFIGGITGKATNAAEQAGFRKSSDLVALRVEGPNQPGDFYRVASQLSQAGLNMRGASASVIGSRYVQILAFDTPADADKAAGLLRGAGKESAGPKAEGKK